jgi:sugar lactone lactonase YvrE
VGSGHAGELLRVGPGETASVLLETGEPEVTAVLPDGAGSVFVATAPRGAVYRLLADGRTEIYGTVEARYIWDLALDPSGRLLAATGDPALLVRLEEDGSSRVLFRAEAESHLTCLLPHPEGGTLAGSDGQGRVYRIDSSGVGEVLLDSSYREIAGLALDGQGVLWAVAVAHRPLVAERPRVRVRVPDPSPQVAAAGEVSATASAAGGGALWGEIEGLDGEGDAEGDPRGALIRMLPGGPAEELWSPRDETPTALALAADGTLVVGTSDPARLYRFGTAGGPERLADLSEGAVTSLGAGPQGGLVATTGQPGVLYRLMTLNAERGELLSRPFDGGPGARWGSLRWDGEVPAGARLELSARAGDSLPPGPGWSDWSAVSGTPGLAPLEVPAGRYLQVRALLSRGEAGRSPVLRGLSVRVRPANRGPRIGAVRLRPPRAEPGQEAPALWSAEWEGEDPDEDPLLVTLELSREPGGAWETLASGRLASPHALALDGREAGTYRLRVRLDDAPSNLPGEGLPAEAQSGPVLLDPAPPRLGELRLRLGEDGRRTATVEADAGADSLQAAWFSVDGGASWWPAGAQDGVLDGPRDLLVATLPPGGGEELVVHVVDGSGSSARARAPLR